jgi:transposase-like protein
MIAIRESPRFSQISSRSNIIRHAVWLYLRFTRSFRDVEDLLAERGLDVSYETVRRWVLKADPRERSDD